MSCGNIRASLVAFQCIPPRFYFSFTQFTLCLVESKGNNWKKIRKFIMRRKYIHRRKVVLFSKNKSKQKLLRIHLLLKKNSSK